MAAAKLFRAIILGPPGSGKGTISSRILKDFTLEYRASGDVLRRQIAEKTELGKKVEELVHKGQLVPDALVLDIINRELNQIKDHPWLLDGFPRTVNQARELSKMQKIDVVMNLDVPFHIIMDRIKGRWIHVPSGRVYHNEFNPPKQKGIDDITGEPLVQRLDDKEQASLARLDTYTELTKPVLDYYREQNLLKNFSGKYSNEIWPKVHEFLATKIKPLQYTRYG